jgi:hypothetical protein
MKRINILEDSMHSAENKVNNKNFEMNHPKNKKVYLDENFF